MFAFLKPSCASHAFLSNLYAVSARLLNKSAKSGFMIAVLAFLVVLVILASQNSKPVKPLKPFQLKLTLALPASCPPHDSQGQPMTLQGDEAIMRLADLVFSQGIVEIHIAAIAALPAEQN